MDIVDSFRLGKEIIADKPCPRKISFSEKNMGFALLGKTTKLKEPKDKTKSEVAEF